MEWIQNKKKKKGTIARVGFTQKLEKKIKRGEEEERR